MLAASQAEPELSIRRDGCLAARLARAPPPPAAAAPLVAEDGSSHLISGGTGGLGLLTARWLAAQQGVGTLVLASNPNPSPNPDPDPNPNANQVRLGAPETCDDDLPTEECAALVSGGACGARRQP